MYHHYHPLSASVLLLPSICFPVFTLLLMCQILNYVLFQIDMEKLAGFLPLHLIAVLMSADRDEALFRYLLSGIRLLYSLCDLAPRHSKLEQVLVVVINKLLFYSVFIIIVLCFFLMIEVFTRYDICHQYLLRFDGFAKQLVFPLFM